MSKTLIDPVFLARLKATKFRPRSARASTGLGDRRSRTIGPGVEFADYRAYQPGDDVRHVDRHVYARHRRVVVRRFVVDQQLRVNVLLDATASMAHGGDAGKAHRARVLTACAATIAVFGGDRVRVGRFTNDTVDWYPQIRNAAGIPRLLEWLGSQPFQGTARIDAVARASSEVAAAHDLLIVISDWMMDGADEAVRYWAAKHHELIGVQVLSPAELNPAMLGEGLARLRDAETGTSIDVALDRYSIDAYRDELRTWQQGLSRHVTRAGGRFLSSTSDEALDDVVFRAWRREGLIT